MLRFANATPKNKTLGYGAREGEGERENVYGAMLDVNLKILYSCELLQLSEMVY